MAEQGGDDGSRQQYINQYVVDGGNQQEERKLVIDGCQDTAVQVNASGCSRIGPRQLSHSAQ